MQVGRYLGFVCYRYGIGSRSQISEQIPSHHVGLGDKTGFPQSYLSTDYWNISRRNQIVTDHSPRDAAERSYDKSSVPQRCNTHGYLFGLDERVGGITNGQRIFIELDSIVSGSAMI